MEKQKTIKDKIHFSGKVFIQEYLLTWPWFHKENNGIVFIRTDKDNTRIKSDCWKYIFYRKKYQSQKK